MRNRRTPTLPEFKAWVRDCTPAARAVLLAQANAEVTRETVDGYTQPIFDRYAFQYSGDLASKCGLSGPIRKMTEIYLTDDPRVPAFFEECDRAHKARGSKLPDGHCPALHAETLLTQTENALIDLAAPMFGVQGHEIFAEQRRKYLDLLIGACVKYDAEHGVEVRL